MFDEFGSVYAIHTGHFNIHQHYLTGVVCNIIQQIAAIRKSTGAGKAFPHGGAP